ncbi:MAG: ComF family protein [Coriobacteriaceae bacterium]|nr:ComF family protein [Coriobacteriaceae bacterium]
MQRSADIPKAYARALAEALAENLWPTRCAICDRPGAVLCARCCRNLPYIDYWSACQRCGAPFGRVQCSECNPVSLQRLGEKELSFSRCTCATVFDDRTAALITTYKDRGERRLAGAIAALLVETLPPGWTQGHCVSFVPATLGALRRRWFDHAELLARNVAERAGLPVEPLFERPRSRDQRKLSRHQRLENMSAGLRLREGFLEGGAPPARVLVVDDVYTTGSTLIAASKALVGAGSTAVSCATFARVW